MARLFHCWLALSAIFALNGLALATERDDEPPKPSTVELVEQIIADESKVNEVRSLYLRFQGTWTRPLPAIARAISEQKKQDPAAIINVEQNSNLWPEMTDELEWAFDKRRVRKLRHWHKVTWDLRVFDGQQAIAYEKSFIGPQEHYALDKSPRDLFHSPWSDLSWLRMGPHAFWFEKQQFTAEGQRQINGLPKDYTHLEQAEYRGRVCYVLENRVAHRKLYVGVDDRRLHGMWFMLLPHDADLLPAINRAAGKTFANTAEANQWAKTLTPEEQKKYAERVNVETYGLLKLWVEHVLDDYREIAPGFWFPETQGYTLLDVKQPGSPPEVTRELRLVEAKVNQPLDDALFTIDLKDGVRVYDRRSDPALIYTQNSKRTPEEWQELIDEQKKQNDQWKQQQAARDALLGQPAPELPESAWLNSAPMTLAALKGKVVVLDFWATTCGPCRNDLPVAEAIHKGSKESGIVVIGVHAADAEKDEVNAFAQEQGLSYPILIDLPPQQKFSAFGLLSGKLNVHGIPYSFVIDQQGKIAGHGPLRDVLKKAEELANAGKK